MTLIHVRRGAVQGIEEMPKDREQPDYVSWYSPGRNQDPLQRGKQRRGGIFLTVKQ